MCRLSHHVTRTIRHLIYPLHHHIIRENVVLTTIHGKANLTITKMSSAVAADINNAVDTVNVVGESPVEIGAVIDNINIV